MRSSVLEAKVLPRLLAGTSRTPLDMEPHFAAGDSKAALKALSLTAQALRFHRPASPARFAVEMPIDDDRRIIPEGARRLVLRLFAGKPVTEHPAFALARTFDELRLRPHPFDLPRLDGFVRAHAERLGATAQHWVKGRAEGAEPVQYFDREDLDDSSWTRSTPSRRAAYLDQRRGADASAGRALLEAAWPGERPEVRARLLRVLQTGLSAADQPFLDVARKDRAPTVRAVAQRLLSRLGAGEGNPALRAGLERIKREVTGLLRKRSVLTLELPATVKEQGAPRWIRETFSEVGFEELARALTLSESELIAASTKDAWMMLALALIATTDRRVDLLERIAGDSLPNAWELMAESGLDDLGVMNMAERARWAELLANPYGTKLPDNYGAWSWLHRIVDGPGPNSLLDTVVKTDWLDQLPSLERHGRHWMEVIAAICPVGRRSALRERLHAIDSSFTSTATLLLEILELLEKAE